MATDVTEVTSVEAGAEPEAQDGLDHPPPGGRLGLGQGEVRLGLGVAVGPGRPVSGDGDGCGHERQVKGAGDKAQVGPSGASRGGRRP